MGRKIIGFLVGIACLVIGIFILISYFNAKNTQTAETTATIIRIDSEMQIDTDGFDKRWYYPVVEYTVDGKRYETRLPDSGTTNSVEYAEGQTVAISYNPDKPEELSKKDSIGGLIGGVAFIIFGIIATVATIIGKV